MNNMVGYVAAPSMFLPPIRAMAYEYVRGSEHVLIRAENPHLEAMALVRDPVVLADVEARVPWSPRLRQPRPYFTWRAPMIPGALLAAFLKRAKADIRNEFCAQFVRDDDHVNARGGWRCMVPAQRVTPTAVYFVDNADAVVDIHSHNTMSAFWSDIDDADETGLRVYVVVGRIDTNRVQARARVGVFGNFIDIALNQIFDDCAGVEVLL